MSARIVCYSLAMFLTAYASNSYGADPAAGEALVKSRCATCHEAKDWEGEKAESLEALINDVVAGKTKHKVKLELSPAEIADIAAFWAAGG